MYKQRILRVVMTILVIVLLTSCTWKEVEVKMQFAPEVGDVQHFNINMDQIITQSVGGEEMTMNQLLGLGFTFTATEADEAQNVWVDINYDWAQLKQTGDTTEVDYDSRTTSDDDVAASAAGFAALIDKGYAIKISPTGEILEVVGIDDMITGMIDELEITDESLRVQMETQLKEQYNEDSLKEQVSNMLVEFPEGAVKIGDTWAATANTSSLVPLTVDTTYTLLAVEDNIATLDATSTISTAPENNLIDMVYYQLQYSLAGTQQGTVYVDTNIGWAVNSVLTQTVTGTMLMSMDGQEVTIPISLFSVVSMDMEQE